MSAVILLDGGTGRELKRIGAPFHQPEWSALALIEAPQFVSKVHASYIAAGAEVLTTNTYAIVPFHIGDDRFRDEGHALAALAGRLARDSANRASLANPSAPKVAVAGSLPPACGSYRAEWFDAATARPILAVLIDGLAPFVDHWLAETLSCTAEARLVRELLGPADAARVKPLWLSFTLEDEVRGEPPARLRSGETVGAAVNASVALGASAVLFNCSQPEVMGAAVSEAQRVLHATGAASRTRIGVYANAFPPVKAAIAEANAELNSIRTDVMPSAYLDWARDWVERGASIIGGCCGIGPEHIAALRAGLQSIELRDTRI
ncbi:MAG: homocysteine S-methyltransferase family protein [Steroidobacteraceae bacterium]